MNVLFLRALSFAACHHAWGYHKDQTVPLYQATKPNEHLDAQHDFEMSVGKASAVPSHPSEHLL